jgi:hypothetical protein
MAGNASASSRDVEDAAFDDADILQTKEWNDDLRN